MTQKGKAPRKKDAVAAPAGPSSGKTKAKANPGPGKRAAGKTGTASGAAKAKTNTGSSRPKVADKTGKAKAKTNTGSPPGKVAGKTGSKVASGTSDSREYRSLAPPDAGMSREAMVERYEPYVRSIAGKIKRSLSQNIGFDDLVGYGMVGLLEAAERFDIRYGANFMTFAYYRVRGAIYDGLRSMGWVSRTEYHRHRFAARANLYLTSVHDQRLGSRDAKRSAEDEIDALAETVEGLVTIYVTALDAMDGLQLEDESLDVEAAVEIGQARQVIRDALAKLPEQEKTVLELYYYQELSLQEVGKKLGLSKSWTSRLHSRAIVKLSKLMGNLVKEYEELDGLSAVGPKKKRKSTQPSDPPDR